MTEQVSRRKFLDWSARGATLAAVPIGLSSCTPGNTDAGTVLRGVTVIDGTGAAPRANLSVHLVGERIVTLAPAAEFTPPTGARVIEAPGRYLIPGLWDMHVHHDAFRYLSPLFVAAGVTGVREMQGAPVHHELRKDILAGTLTGPRMIISSSFIDGRPPVWPDSASVDTVDGARAAVRAAKVAGSDFVKVYTRLGPVAYRAVADEAKALGLPFCGHVPELVSVIEAAELGHRSMEHLNGLFFATSDRHREIHDDLVELSAPLPKQDIPVSRDVKERLRWRALDLMAARTTRPELEQALFATLVRHNAWQVPTLSVLRTFGRLGNAIGDRDWLRYVPPFMLKGWEDGLAAFRQQLDEEGVRGQLELYERQLQLVGAMHRAGVPILAGTDAAPVPYCIPGFGLHDELALLVEAGLTPMAALQSATVSPARYLGLADQLGTVEPGKLADLVLLTADPLADIRNTTMIDTVVLRGRVIDQAERSRLLAEAEEAAGRVTVPPAPSGGFCCFSAGS